MADPHHAEGSERDSNGTTLRVAAVQCESWAGEAERNLANAERWVEAAASQGAALVLCPELLAAGYTYDASLWRSAEPRGGATETWLCRLAARHRIHIGATYLEVEGDDFYNTFALAAPDGSIVGRVRKESLPAFEGWFFRSSDESKVIETVLGRIAVGICQDNHTARFMNRVRDDRPDLILMPHSGPCFPGGGPMMRDGLREIAPFYARAFGVPVVMVNKVGSRTLSPLPGVPFVRVPFEFFGPSSIVDADGRVVAHIEGEEGVVCAEITSKPRKRRWPSATDPYWSRVPRGPASLAGRLLVVMERLGKRAYAGSAARVAAARALAGQTADG